MDGELCWSAVRELVRVAIAETEKEWTEAAKGKTTRQVEELVAGQVRRRPERDERGQTTT